MDYEIIEFLLNNQETLRNNIKPNVIEYLYNMYNSDSSFRMAYSDYFNTYILNLIKNEIYGIFNDRLTYEQLEIIFDKNDILDKIDFNGMFCKKDFYETVGKRPY